MQGWSSMGPLASFLIFGAQWSHLAFFCRNPVFLLSASTIPDSLAFWVMTSLTFTFLGVGGGVCLCFFCFLYGFRTCRVGHLECPCLITHISIFDRRIQKLLQRPMPDVTSSPGRGLSSSTNERGCSHLGCHHAVIQ